MISLKLLANKNRKKLELVEFQNLNNSPTQNGSIFMNDNYIGFTIGVVKKGRHFTLKHFSILITLINSRDYL